MLMKFVPGIHPSKHFQIEELLINEKAKLTRKVFQYRDIVNKDGPHVPNDTNAFQSPIRQFHKAITVGIYVVSVDGFHDD